MAIFTATSRGRPGITRTNSAEGRALRSSGLSATPPYMLRNGRLQPRESSGRLGNERKEVKIMKHINLKLQKLEERIAPGGCGCGTGGSHGSKGGSNKSHGSKSHGSK